MKFYYYYYYFLHKQGLSVVLLELSCALPMVVSPCPWLAGHPYLRASAVLVFDSPRAHISELKDPHCS